MGKLKRIAEKVGQDLVEGMREGLRQKEAEQATDIKPGALIAWNGGYVRVMAVAGGYAMCRRPRCMPFAVSLKDLARGKRL